MTSILPPTRDLTHRLRMAEHTRHLLDVAMVTVQLDRELIEEIAATADRDTLLPDIANCVLGFREALDSIAWPDDEDDA